MNALQANEEIRTALREDLQSVVRVAAMRSIRGGTRERKKNKKWMHASHRSTAYR